LKQANGGIAWTDWTTQDAPAEAVEHFRREQWLFFSQFRTLRAACKERGILLMGDIPIYVAHDSADVWSNPSLFKLDERGRLLVQAGVPPDYFSATGQLWGNPIYDW